MSKLGKLGEEEKAAWLLEHLYYEWSMLNYTIERIRVLPRGNEYNTNYESFCVHARLLSMFLTNGDTGNFGAADFVDGFRSRKPNDVITLYNKIDPQVMHLAPKRPVEWHKKFNSTECTTLFGWLDAEFKEFFAKLPLEVQGKWIDKEKSKAAKVQAAVTIVGSSPGASSQPQGVLTHIGKASGAP
jgi:hypothetical protein